MHKDDDLKDRVIALIRIVWEIINQFSIVFIPLTMIAVASFLESQSLVVDILTVIANSIREIDGLYDVVIFFGSKIAIILDWWRQLFGPLLGWIKENFAIDVPQEVFDFISVIFFSITRWHSVYRTSRKKSDKTLSDVQKQLQERYKNDKVKQQMVHTQLYQVETVYQRARNAASPAAINTGLTMIVLLILDYVYKVLELSQYLFHLSGQ